MMHKRWISVMMLICICSQLCACAYGGKTVNDASSVMQGESQPTVSTASPLESDTDVPKKDGNVSALPISGEIPLLTIETYDEYLAFVEKAKLPPEFVHYESVAQFGEFKSFVCLSDARMGDFSSCMYSMVDESQSEFVLYIDIGDVNGEKLPLSNITDVNSTNLRVLDNKADSGTFVISGLEYKYVAGKLLSVSWTRGTVSYTLSGNSMLGDYPESATTTAVGKMLNTQTAKVFLDALHIDEAVS